MFFFTNLARLSIQIWWPNIDVKTWMSNCGVTNQTAIFYCHIFHQILFSSFWLNCSFTNLLFVCKMVFATALASKFSISKNIHIFISIKVFSTNDIDYLHVLHKSGSQSILLRSNQQKSTALVTKLNNGYISPSLQCILIKWH